MHDRVAGLRPIYEVAKEWEELSPFLENTLTSLHPQSVIGVSAALYLAYSGFSDIKPTSTSVADALGSKEFYYKNVQATLNKGSFMGNSRLFRAAGKLSHQSIRHFGEEALDYRFPSLAVLAAWWLTDETTPSEAHSLFSFPGANTGSDEILFARIGAVASIGGNEGVLQRTQLVDLLAQDFDKLDLTENKWFSILRGLESAELVVRSRKGGGTLHVTTAAQRLLCDVVEPYVTLITDPDEFYDSPTYTQHRQRLLLEPGSQAESASTLEQRLNRYGRWFNQR